jgi:hypothetical protein
MEIFYVYLMLAKNHLSSPGQTSRTLGLQLNVYQLFQDLLSSKSGLTNMRP